jgi:hypothetical protein
VTTLSHARSATRGGRERALLAALFCLFGGAVIGWLPWMEHRTIYALIAGMVLLWVAPMWNDWRRARLDAFETVHVVGFLYVVFFGLGALWSVESPDLVAYDRYLVDYMPRAALYCLIGWLALLAGYYGPWGIGAARMRYRERVRGVLFLAVPGFCGMVGYVALAAWQTAEGFGRFLPAAVGSLSQLSPLFLFAWGVAWILHFSGRATRAQRLLLFLGFVPAACLIGLVTLSNKSLAMTLAGVPIMALWYGRRRIPWLFMVTLLLVLVFVVFPFYNTFRYTDARIAQTTRLEATADTIGRWNSDHYLQQSLGAFKERLALVNSVAIVIRDVGRWVPYAKGETLFYPTVAFFVPRVLWPEKPMLTLGREFGRTFRVIPEADRKTFIAATVPGELYWNFDLPGIVFGMALWGIAMRALYRRFGQAGLEAPVAQGFHLIVVIEFAHWGGGIASGVVGLTRTLMLLAAFCWVGRNWGLLEREPIEAEEAVPAVGGTDFRR